MHTGPALEKTPEGILQKQGDKQIHPKATVKNKPHYSRNIQAWKRKTSTIMTTRWEESANNYHNNDEY